MTGIIIVGAIGLICAILLVVASHFLSVPIDTRVEDIRGFLPGANCGACGYAGCDDYAKAVANGSAKPNLCIPGGASVSAQISEYLGVAAENTEPVKATVRCSGTCEKCGEAEDYHGPATCAACAALHRGKKACGCPSRPPDNRIFHRKKFLRGVRNRKTGHNPCFCEKRFSYVGQQGSGRDPYQS